MKEIIITDKQKYLNENYPFADVPDISEKMKCIHCDREFEVSQYRVLTQGQDEFICCPYEDCDGSVIDWVDVKA